MPTSETPSQTKPVGVAIVAALLVGVGGMGALIGLAMLLALLTNLGEAVAWLLGPDAAATGLLGYVAIRIGLGLLRDPAENRAAAERAIWVMIPIVWVAIGAISAIVMEGTIDAIMVLVSSASALFWSAVLAAGALYMRSSRVRSYFKSMD